MDRAICPLCTSPLKGDPVELAGTSKLLECARCGLQVWEPRTAGSAHWYDESAHYATTEFIDWLGWYHRRALDEMRPDVRTLLDIGCGDGRFVYAAVARGIDAIGIDHSERLVALAHTRHGPGRVSRRSIADLQNEGRRFDAVSMFDVLEHVPEPLGLLQLARSLLRDDGVLIVTTPSRLGYPWGRHPLDRPPHHLTRWTPGVLAFALEAAGFGSPRVVQSSGTVGVRAFLMDHVRFGLVRRALAAGPAGRPPGSPVRRRVLVRILVVAKDRAIRVLARVLAPLIGRRLAGGSLLAFARRADVRSA